MAAAEYTIVGEKYRSCGDHERRHTSNEKIQVAICVPIYSGEEKKRYEKSKQWLQLNTQLKETNNANTKNAIRQKTSNEEIQYAICVPIYNDSKRRMQHAKKKKLFQ